MSFLRTFGRLRRPLAIFVLVCCVVWLSTLAELPTTVSEWQTPFEFLKSGGGAPHRMPNADRLAPLPARIACLGPREALLTESVDDELHPVSLAQSYPVPFVGSHEAIGLEMTWMTVDGRYGPYGWGEEKDSYQRSRVAWNKINWGDLQNDCFERNAQRFPPGAAKFDNRPRFQLLNKTSVPAVRSWDQFNSTRRTALIVRAWDAYEYKREDLHYLRSLVVETSLRTGGEYQVVLLVNIKDSNLNIFSSHAAYNEALKKAVPKELEPITVLWDDNLLESWYPQLEHRTMWQVYQPIQLFALFYPEFDHFWQLELDMRFTGDAGKFLDALAAFARHEPRKQALERATFMHMAGAIGDYTNFTRAVDRANHGSAHFWGPLTNPDIKPIGPVPPVRKPTQDNFTWGVGEDADVILTSFCANATASRVWTFRDWIGGFSAQGAAVPRYFCPPAIQRASRALLFAIHEAQFVHGMRVPSEATLPSFALWYGLKLSYPPHPVYWHKKEDRETLDGWWKGGPEASPSGLGPEDPGHPGGDGLTFWWESNWPRKIMDAWMRGSPTPSADDFPWLLSTIGDQVFIPNMMVHPMKRR